MGLGRLEDTDSGREGRRQSDAGGGERMGKGNMREGGEGEDWKRWEEEKGGEEGKGS